MKCNLKYRETTLQEYLNGDMSESEMATFEEHFLDCDDCTEELKESLHLIEFVQNEGNHLFSEFQNSEKLKGKIRSNAEISTSMKFFRYIISAKRLSFGIITIVVILFLYMFYLSFTNLTIDEKITSNELDSSRSTDYIQEYIQNKENLIVESESDLDNSNFEISPNLEYLLNQNYRSNYNIEIISPANESYVIDKIHFEIKNNSNEKLNLRIIDNQENPVYSSAIDKSILSIDVAKHKLSPGLYYWKLENDEEIIYVGKFFIRKEFN